MSEEKTAVQKLYEDPKSKNFVNHLIRAYLPVYKPQKVWTFPDKNPHKCNVCSHDLIDIDTAFTRLQNSQNLAADFADQIRKQINGEEIKYEDHFMVKNVTHGAVLAFQGEKTTTYLCQGCIKDLLDLVTTNLLMGDKNIAWITKQMQRDQIFSHFRESPALDQEDKKEVEVIEKKAAKRKATFGDIEVLQQLKAKMEAEQNGVEK